MLQSLKKVMKLARGGSDLIDIALSLFIIVALITAVLTTAVTYKHIRKTQLQNTAAKVASKKIESLRNQPYSSLQNVTNQSSSLPELPIGIQYLTITDDPTYPGTVPNIKHVTVQITWKEQTANREITLKTIISQNGLSQQ